MTATTRSASMMPSSMSLASSDASLTVCSGILRTSMGAGTGLPSRGGRGSGVGVLSGGGVGGPHAHDGAGVVTGDGVGDVLEGCDDGSAPCACGAASFDEA